MLSSKLSRLFHDKPPLKRYLFFSFKTDHLVEGFASDLVVTDDIFLQNSLVDDSMSAAGLLFCLDDQTVLYSKNIFKKLNPASTTKLLTCLCAIKYGNLDDTITVSQNAVNLEYLSSRAGFNEGDTITLRDALYAMMLPSGNDAATAIAEHVGGSVEAFCEMMNKEAQEIGATSTHYVNAHGLTDPDHYTTAYDLYLIINEGLKYDLFKNVITTASYTATYHDISGNEVTQTWTSTNAYLSGTYTPPSGVSPLGGKTGTTSSAGSCLVLYSTANGKYYISIVLGAQSRDQLYTHMSQILSITVI